MSAAVTSGALGPVARLFNGSQQCTVESADLRRSTLTLRIADDVPVPRGKQLLISETQALALLAFEKAGVRLQREEGKVRVLWFYMGEDLDFRVEAPGFEATIYYRREQKDSRLPGRYWGSQSRTDQWGREWSTRLPEMVTDDFGSLVPVDGGLL